MTDTAMTMTTAETAETAGTETEIRAWVRARYPWVHGSELDRYVARERADFELATRRAWGRVTWLAAGLEHLSEHGQVYVTFLSHTTSGRARSLDELREEISVAVEEAREAGDDAPHALLDAWIEQSEYALWRRVRDYEEVVADLARDLAISIAAGEDGSYFGTYAAEQWELVVASFVQEVEG